MTSDHINAQDSYYKKALFSNVRTSSTNYKNFYFAYLNDSIIYQGEIGHKFIFVDYITNDTFIGYWGVSDYSLFYWSEHSYKKNCTQIILFASIKPPNKYSFCEKKCYEYRRLAIGGNCIDITNSKIDMSLGTIETKHLVSSGHMSHQPSHYRKYTISYSDGIIAYQTDYPKIPTIINFPY